MSAVSTLKIPDIRDLNTYVVFFPTFWSLGVHVGHTQLLPTGQLAMGGSCSKTTFCGRERRSCQLRRQPGDAWGLGCLKNGALCLN